MLVNPQNIMWTELCFIIRKYIIYFVIVDEVDGKLARTLSIHILFYVCCENKSFLVIAIYFVNLLWGLLKKSFIQFDYDQEYTFQCVTKIVCDNRNLITISTISKNRLIIYISKL